MGNMEEKNTVEAADQVAENVYLLGNQGGSPKIMFLGNSITMHGYAPQIGWHGNWGMAASSADKDYVHILRKGISGKYPNASFLIAQGANWEISYFNGCSLDELFSGAKDYDPDVIICLLGENIPSEYFEEESFISAFHKLHNYLGTNNTKLIVASSFFNNEAKTNAIKKYCDKYNADFVYISDIILNKENLAEEFEHPGIKIHPGDKGMKIIAERIFDVFNGIELQKR